ncbi:hypothetical protein MRBLWO14_000997 [Microbacterium sp. LWO14-1.2]|uniref:hypothetical protein n=1 Tax=Microbacterium sp. LWO14-1.2 TaxID=3135263 RepID=UPI003138A49F
MGGMQYVYWMGARLTPWMLYCLKLLDADLRRLFGVSLVLHSTAGIRLHEEQKALFLSRYQLQASGTGPYGDVRWWQGRRYVRHSGDGTVAPPSESNHEIQGTTAAVDVADSGGAGIGTMGSARSNWLRANASKYGLIPEGFKFKEAWHYAIPDIFRAVPAGGADAPEVTEPESEEDDDMRNPAMFCTTANDKMVSETNLPNTYIVTDSNGFFHQVSGIDGTYASRIAQAYGVTVDAQWITQSHAVRLERDCAAMRPTRS